MADSEGTATAATAATTKGNKGAEAKNSDATKLPHIRIVIQRCEHAVLKVRKSQTLTGADDSEREQSESVNSEDFENREIDRGLIVFVCFFKEATESDVQKLASTLITLNICERPVDDSKSKGGSEKLVNILDLPGDLLLIPQATLSGKLKSKFMQYHTLIGKQEGEALYRSFIALCEDSFAKSGAAQRGNKVKYGEYGARQILSTVTNGPFTHILDL